MMRPVLSIGTKTYSSWSMRAWFPMVWSGLDFEERMVELDAPGYGTGTIPDVAAASPSGRVPALDVGSIVIWDSLAICEWIAEQAPQAGLWPVDPYERAIARSLTAEMHSGFAAIRNELPCNIRRRSLTPALTENARRELARIEAIFAAQAERSKGRGPYMFGRRGIVDAFYLPIATRLRSFSVAVNAAAAAYRDTLLGDEAFLRWEREAEAAWTKPFSRADVDPRTA